VFGRGGVLDDLSLGHHDLGNKSSSSSSSKYQAYSSSYRYR
jgi:hypothetical protein